MKPKTLAGASLLLALLAPATAHAGIAGWVLDLFSGWGLRVLYRVAMLARRVLLPHSDQWLWFALACALTLVWLLGIPQVRNWICRLSGLAWKVVMAALIIATLMEVWREMPDFIKWAAALGAFVILIMAVVSIIPVITALYSTATSAIGTVTKTAESLLETEAKFSWKRAVSSALLITAVLNCRWLSTPGNDYFPSVVSSLMGLSVIGWYIIGRVKKSIRGEDKTDDTGDEAEDAGPEAEGAKSEAEGAKPKDQSAKPENRETRSDSRPAKSSCKTKPEPKNPQGSFASCPHCGKPALGERFCGHCGTPATSPAISNSAPPIPPPPIPPPHPNIWDL